MNIHTIDGFDVRTQVVGLVAHHLKLGILHKAAQVGDGAFRRLAQKIDLERRLARVARADCLDRRDYHALISAAGHHRHDRRCHPTTIAQRPVTRTHGGRTEAQ